MPAPLAAKNAISLKEAREALYWLRVIERCRLAPAERVQPLMLEASELTAMLTAGMKRLRPAAPRILSAIAFTSFVVLVLSSQF